MQRRPDLVGDDRLRPAAAQLDPELQPALTAGNRLYAPGAGGKLLVKADADSPSGALQTLVFYGAAAYAAAPAAYDASVFINTPITVDRAGQRLLRLHRHRRQPGGAGERHRPRRADGTGTWVSARLSRRRRRRSRSWR